MIPLCSSEKSRAESTACLCRFVDLEGLGEVKSAERHWSQHRQICESCLVSNEGLQEQHTVRLEPCMAKVKDRTLVGTYLGPEFISWLEQSLECSLHVTFKATDFGSIENESWEM